MIGSGRIWSGRARRAAALAALLMPFGDAPRAAPQTVASPAEFAAAIAAAGPGDVIVVAPGTHRDWELVIPTAAAGAPGRPIRIAPAEPGTVTFAGKSRFEIDGSHIEIAGFAFDRTGAPSVVIRGSHNRATGLEFRAAGNRRKPHAPILVIGTHGSDNEIDRCLFVGSESTSIQISMRKFDPQALPLRNWIHHNEFRDIPRYSRNGQEPIQIGQGPGGTSRLMTRVEDNRFVRADGDDELISVKTSGNVIRGNFASDSAGGISLRGGNGNLVEGNVLLRTKRGIVVTGDAQVVINNFVDAPRKEGILLAVGSKRYRAATNAVIAHNTVIRADMALGFVLRDPAVVARPTGNRIVNNIFVARRSDQAIVAANRGLPLDEHLAANTVEGNLFWWADGGTARAVHPFHRGDGNMIADPQLDLTDPQVPRLKATSPARGSGLQGYATADSTSAPRGRSTPPDIGVLQAAAP